MSEAGPIERLIHAFTRLPGVGGKTAARLAFFVLDSEEHVARELAEALFEVKRRIRLCSRCCTLTEADPCALCADPRRDDSVLCVVESVPGLMAVERTGEFRGRYHVLHGLIAPLDGVGPGDIRLRELVGRMSGAVREVIIATSPSVEGEATALYIHRICGGLGPRITRIASGVPIGSDLEYADQVTLARALQGRREL